MRKAWIAMALAACFVVGGAEVLANSMNQKMDESITEVLEEKLEQQETVQSEASEDSITEGVIENEKAPENVWAETEITERETVEDTKAQDSEESESSLTEKELVEKELDELATETAYAAVISVTGKLEGKDSEEIERNMTGFTITPFSVLLENGIENRMSYGSFKYNDNYYIFVCSADQIIDFTKFSKDDVVDEQHELKEYHTDELEKIVKENKTKYTKAAEQCLMGILGQKEIICMGEPTPTYIASGDFDSGLFDGKTFHSDIVQTKYQCKDTDTTYEYYIYMDPDSYEVIGWCLLQD